jgi:hypothetical protein
MAVFENKKEKIVQQKTFDLNTLNGLNGFTILGMATSDRLGISVSMVGDLNGDDLSDLALGATGPNSGAGASYVIFGSQGGFSAFFNLTNLNGSSGFTVPGVAAGGYLGGSVSTAGDMNGDGINDLVLGAPYANWNAGAGYVIFGTRMGFASFFNLTNLNGTNGFTVPGIAANGYLGTSVSTVGDVNGDGVSDLVLGASNANSKTGVSYVIFGNRGGFAPSFNLNSLNGTNGFSVPGVAAGDQLGISVSTAGDVNGDGIDDLVLGAFGTNSLAGASVVIFGNRGGFSASFNLNNLNGSNGFTVLGIATGGVLGYSVSTAGDMNGDGIHDLVLGSHGTNSGAGASYIIFGSRGGFASFFNLNNLNGTNGFTVLGVATGDVLGYSVSTAGDMNGDGISDLVLGSHGTNSGAGASYLIFGSRSRFASPFNLTNLNGSNGFTVPGAAAGSNLGYSVSTAGDVNGDGVGDLVLGAYGVNANVGASYVIFGGLASVTLTHNELAITEGQTLVLTSDNLTMVGLIAFDSFAFKVIQVQGGRFTLVNNPATAIFNFTQAQINGGQIQFISDRSAPVAYQVGIYNVSGGHLALQPLSANVTFTNHAPVVINIPSTKVVETNQPFHFTIQGNQTFKDSDGDPLMYSAKLSNGSPLPSWMRFDASQPNQLDFSGTAPSAGGTRLSLWAKDPLNATANTEFEVLAQLGNNRTNVNIPTSTANIIAASVAGGLLGLGGLLIAAWSFWEKNTRREEYFADYIRDALKLKGVNNFKTDETGRKYVAFVHDLIQGLGQAGIDTATMHPSELRALANDVAASARNKITPATDCLGRSEITVTDLSEKTQELINEVLLLRSGFSKPQSYIPLSSESKPGFIRY